MSSQVLGFLMKIFVTPMTTKCGSDYYRIMNFIICTRIWLIIAYMIMGSKKHQKEINQEVQLIQNMYLQVFNGLINEVTEAFNEEVYTATSNLINTLGLDMNELKLTEFRKSAAELGREI